MLAERFRHFGDERRAVVRVADILLDLVEHEDDARRATVTSDELQHAPERGEKLLGREVGVARRKLGLQRVARFCLGGRKVRVACHQRARDRTADVEVVQLGSPPLARRLDALLDLIEPALVVQPEAELRLRVLVRKPDAAQEHGEDRHPDVVRRPAGQRSGRGEQAACALARGVELAKEAAKVIWHRWHEAASRRTIGKLRVGPEVAQHLQKMRLAAAEEPADPRRLLAGLGDVPQIRGEDPLKAVRVLPLADERRQLAAQLFEDLVVRLVGDARLPLIHQGMRGGISLKDVLDFHDEPPALSIEIGTAM